MIPMKMRDEDSLNLREADMRAAQLYLRTLPTVDHKELSANLHDLRRCEMLQGGQRTAAA